MQFHPQRERLLGEVHARPSTPLDLPVFAMRVASLSGDAEADRAHLAALCRDSLLPEPPADALWWLFDAGDWSLRWERHSEFSSWTVFSRLLHAGPPKAWLAALPGEVLVSTRADVRRSTPEAASAAVPLGSTMIGAAVLEGAASIFTDFKAEDGDATRWLVLMHSEDRVQTGRLVQMVLEIETYRLMALLAFPLAGSAGRQVAAFESEAGSLAAQLAQDSGVEADRALLARLVALSGEAEALNAQTSYRFRAGAAYHDIVRDRIAGLREERITGMQTLGEFMERRLAPAMRTCQAVAAREAAVIERIARTGQMLRTRINIESEATNAALLASMDKRAATQLRLQRTVEGLSVAAIAYYAVSLLSYPVKAVEHVWPRIDAAVTIGLLAPVVILFVWLALRRLRKGDD